MTLYPGRRLAPHRALRHLILSTLLEAGVLEPITSRRRLDDAVSEASWSEGASLEDSDWLAVAESTIVTRAAQRMKR